MTGGKDMFTGLAIAIGVNFGVTLIFSGIVAICKSC